MARRPELIDEDELSGIVDFLIEGYWVYDNIPPFSLETSGRDNAITVNVSGLSAVGKSLARDSFEAWEAVADITFREINGAAQITFAESGARADTVFDFNANNTKIIGSTVTIGPGWLDRYGTDIGTFSFQTYLHEIGHALGLGHSGEYISVVPTYPGGLLFDEDSWQVTVMSYYGQDRNLRIDATRASPITPQAADIIAIQELYGAPDGAATAGDDVYGVGSTLDSYLGRYFREVYEPDRFPPTDVTYTIVDSGGTDTIDVSHLGRGSTAFLAPGAISDLSGKTGNVIIMPGTVIENFIAGRGTDTVTGNDADNFIDGGGGDDALFGGAGQDNLRGEEGNDRISGGTGADEVHGGFGDDRLIGNAGNDIVFGDGGGDEISGGGGDDEVRGGAGNDRLSGGGGRDAVFGDGGKDTLSGNGGRDLLDGGGGNDRLNGGGGRDTLDGGLGSDMLSGGGGRDRIVGGSGSDAMTGGGGRDTFVFTRGKDVITDFSEADRLLFATALARDGTLAVADVIDAADVIDGSIVVQFGGNRLTLNGFRDIDTFADSIDIL